LWVFAIFAVSSTFAKQALEHATLMILAAEEDGEDAHEAPLIIDVEIEHGATFGNRA